MRINAAEHTLTIEVTGTTEQGYTARITALTGAQDINALTDYGVQLEVQARSAGEALVLMGQNFQRAGFLE